MAKAKTEPTPNTIKDVSRAARGLQGEGKIIMTERTMTEQPFQELKPTVGERLEYHGQNQRYH